MPIRLARWGALAAAAAVGAVAALGVSNTRVDTAPASAQAAASDVITTDAGARLALVSCALRNTGSGWHIISDTAHTPSGCGTVVQHADHLELRHPVGAAQVSALTVTVDETYARSGLRVGASVGLDLSRIYLYSGAAGTAPLNPSTVAASSGNLWVSGYLRL
ncbi:hypothetical protein [Streptomyces sp. enrichment culture]|uniref:hypothetical protein n=1 Tax=Streptomyces sp. enrichment culture TaxID=1795815 RepID=UPI003F568F74